MELNASFEWISNFQPERRRKATHSVLGQEARIPPLECRPYKAQNIESLGNQSFIGVWRTRQASQRGVGMASNCRLVRAIYSSIGHERR